MLEDFGMQEALLSKSKRDILWLNYILQISLHYIFVQFTYHLNTQSVLNQVEVKSSPSTSASLP